ncbi:hypothetical protein F5Y14DRAFT_417243 [Nemania sp. NC0429]|nr:hypothetical protein F5Y14DRAFT_417243 [Nemania sp. NC0429]
MNTNRFRKSCVRNCGLCGCCSRRDVDMTFKCHADGLRSGDGSTRGEKLEKFQWPSCPHPRVRPLTARLGFACNCPLNGPVSNSWDRYFINLAMRSALCFVVLLGFSGCFPVLLLRYWVSALGVGIGCRYWVSVLGVGIGCRQGGKWVFL